MFDIGWSELLLIAIVAIIVIGPKDLPAALRTFGKFTGRMKRMARDFQSQFNEAIREAELDTVAKDVKSMTRLDPLADLRKDLNKVGSDIATGLNKPVDTEMKAIAAEKGTDEPAPVTVADKPAEVLAAPAATPVEAKP
jgi:sec-independent protein translocase protein TatB